MDEVTAPSLTERAGYVLRHRDLNFLSLTVPDLEAMVGKGRPLRMPAENFVYFVRTLGETFARLGLTDCDVRLQGSSTHFFSGAHKALPWSREDVTKAFIDYQARPPHGFEIDRVLSTLESLWPQGSPRPAARMFDLMSYLGIDPSPSDIDVQISSGQLYERCRHRLAETGVPPERFRKKSKTYGYVKKQFVKAVAPGLDFWADEQSAMNRRLVSVVVFPAEGPPVAEESAVSSHFREGDWVIDVRTPEGR